MNENFSPLALVRKEALDHCYGGILAVTNNLENMQIHYRKFNDKNWQKLMVTLETAMETLHEITQTKLD